MIDCNVLIILFDLFNETGNDTCIDNIYSKTNLQTKALKLIHQITDRYPWLLHIDLNNVISKQDTDFVFKVDYNKLNILGSLENFNTCTKVTKKVKIKSNRKKISFKKRLDYCRCSCNTKNKLYNDWQKDLLNTLHENKYKKYANKLSNIIKYLKCDYEKKKVLNQLRLMD